jgi:anti-sigma factor RsiW
MSEDNFEPQLSAYNLRAPDHLRSRVQQSLRAESTPQVSRPRTDWRWLAAAAVLAGLAVTATWAVASRRAGDQLVMREVLASHVRSLIGTHLTDVASTDQHTVKPWFNGKVDYSPTVSDFAGRGFPLIGGRLDYIGTRRVAALVYARRQHIINVFVWPADNAADRAPQTVTVQGYHMLHWTTGDYVYWVVSDLGEAELRQLTSLIKDSDPLTR